MNKSIFSIAIDGPCGAGKSSVAKRVAKELGVLYLDTGAMYRAVGLYMLRNEICLEAAAISAHAAEPAITVKYEDGVQKTFLFDEDVSGEIRTPEVSNAASQVATVDAVRWRMVDLQREIAGGISLVMDGRDIGTCVLPDATLKVYLTASAEVRAMRRFLENQKTGSGQTYQQVLDDVNARDINDTTREHSPLMKAADAVVVDSSDMTEDEVVRRVIELLFARIRG